MVSADKIFRKMCGVKLTSFGVDVLESNSETHPREKNIMKSIQCMCLLKEIHAYACRTHLSEQRTKQSFHFTAVYLSNQRDIYVW